MLKQDAARKLMVLLLKFKFLKKRNKVTAPVNTKGLLYVNAK